MNNNSALPVVGFFTPDRLDHFLDLSARDVTSAQTDRQRYGECDGPK
jgi:hypothetical protein